MTIGGTSYGYHTTEVDYWYERPQKRVVRGNGTLLARDLEPRSEYRQYELRRLSASQKDTLAASLQYFANSTVSVIDDMGNSFNAALWDKKLTFRHRLGGLWSVNLTFRVV